ncbi:hypothetical protein TWF106_002602 [Orbilia oligospora]|uniref:glucan endo-1,3-alpha-glucosidase n=1 Tax=Orbilia oligospora TaxID=2813651 RepID=A0A6G1MM82_ORBOL|nr:hypothetical protein TWF788_004735 [Orbilia oligospora]KAF3199554.1 hypothetical protein TWF679_001293 [Orbilia oligospora]KAF3206704.1 hypothetical protein TWF191_001371 [Orbilia oligospora]KAF3225466.1 hypothetical protein TWF106_002602 [Orbilia oligospora]KAF3263698.1 hypothetical protein TWF192_005972 [Orbilia oligospora]
MILKIIRSAYLLSVAAVLFAPSLAAPKEYGLEKRESTKYVYAHFMVGIVEFYTVDDWKWDMELAKDTGIDGFALNCASIDSYTPTQLANAYEAAKQVGFKVFISFDFAYWNNGQAGMITDYVRLYADHPAQALYDGGAIVSTFVGDSFNWQQVKNGVSHKVAAMPMFQDPAGVTGRTDVDGAFSWLAWPTYGGNSIAPLPMTTIWDDKFITNLAGKPYMMPVSPWFSTHFNSKNWVFVCEHLITERWKQVLQLNPALIEIITWNDYGESHYIGPWEPNHTDDGSAKWADGMPHDGWRIITKAYIEAYKAGLSAPSVSEDSLVYWYRPHPKAATCTSDTLGRPNGADMLYDNVYVTTLLTAPATLVVQSGSNSVVRINVPAGVLTSNVTMGIGAQRFSLERGGQVIMGGTGGLEIKNSCTVYNFNVYVGSLPGGDSSPTSTTTATRSSSTITRSSTSSTGGNTSTTRSCSRLATQTATVTTTSTTYTTVTVTSNPGGPSSVCVAGTGSNNYIGLCLFCCGYGYCPPGPCTCSAYGAQVQPPPKTSRIGLPANGLDDSYSGLCSFACDHGYCPSTACRYA